MCVTDGIVKNVTNIGESGSKCNAPIGVRCLILNLLRGTLTPIIEMMNRSNVYILLLVATLCWCAGIVLPAWLASGGTFAGSLSAEVYRFYSYICHQFDSRSLHLFGHKFAVCARCSAIYGGFLVGICIVPFLARRRLASWGQWPALGCVPMMLDAVLDMFRIHASTMTSRLATGGMFGVAAALILVPIMLEVFAELLSHFPLHQGARNEPQT